MKILLAAAVALGMSVSAAVADEPTKQPDWTGVYVGAFGGYGFGSSDVDLSHSTGAIFYNDPFVPDQGSLSDPDGWFFGGQIGADKQFDRVVVGVVVDLSKGNMDASNTFTTPLGSQWAITSDLEMFGTARVRVGYLIQPHVLAYVSGGVAWGRVDVKQATTFVDGNGDFLDDGGRTSGKFDHVGYAIGGGLEWMLADGWSLTGEYLYIDLGGEDYQLKGTTKPNGNVPYVETFGGDLSMHTLRVGVNYRF